MRRWFGDCARNSRFRGTCRRWRARSSTASLALLHFDFQPVWCVRAGVAVPAALPAGQLPKEATDQRLATVARVDEAPHFRHALLGAQLLAVLSHLPDQISLHLDILIF